jgi:hypothetical protein
VHAYELFQAISEKNHFFSSDTLRKFLELMRCPSVFDETSQTRLAELSFLARHFGEQLEKDKHAFMGELIKCADAVNSLKAIGCDEYELELTLQKVGEGYDAMDDAHALLKNAIEMSALFQRRQTMLGYRNVTQYPEINDLQREIDPFVEFWTIADRVYDSEPKWLDNPFIELPASEIQEAVVDWDKNLQGLHERLEEHKFPEKAWQLLSKKT